jgi:hypothetical protein
MTNKEIIQISKSKPKKFSILCTFKQGGTKEEVNKSFILTAFVTGMSLLMMIHYIIILKQTRKKG